MQILLVTIQIKQGHKGAFMASMLEDARGSVQNEPGCLRFDVMQDKEDPNRIHLYEVYRDEAAIEAHRRAPHYLKWRETVKDWHASEPIRRQCTTVFPAEASWRK
ncbi:MAG: putative quinol monooxygenase [Dehalococcoidia bacterium]|nr:putative quinol monooxygenase [Dehalococcoidia bacterium]